MARVKQEECEDFDEEKFARLSRYSYVFMYVQSQIEVVLVSQTKQNSDTFWNPCRNKWSTQTTTPVRQQTCEAGQYPAQPCDHASTRKHRAGKR
mmetsp:Transcript_60440/g.97938  ORF Transcript_60440/g.97938 Transcript_60440/m.97938 type:complete len:94 (-) Transcript_60440:193-474(-)